MTAPLPPGRKEGAMKPGTFHVEYKLEVDAMWFGFPLNETQMYAIRESVGKLLVEHYGAVKAGVDFRRTA